PDAARFTSDDRLLAAPREGGAVRGQRRTAEPGHTARARGGAACGAAPAAARGAHSRRAAREALAELADEEHLAAPHGAEPRAQPRDAPQHDVAVVKDDAALVADDGEGGGARRG